MKKTNLYKKYGIPKEIELAAGVTLQVVLYDSEDNHGEFNGDKKTIFLNKGSLKGWRSTLAHEMVHAVLWYGGLNEILSSEEEEGVTRCIENILFPLLLKYKVLK